jgi:hypothetical protein
MPALARGSYNLVEARGMAKWIEEAALRFRPRTQTLLQAVGLGYFRPREAWAVLVEAKPVGILLAGFIGAWSVGGLRSDPSAAAMTMAGLLELAGLGLVFWDLVVRPGEFSTPGIWHNLRDWFRRLVAALRKPPPAVLDIHGASHGHSADSADVTVRLQGNATFDERLEHLQLQVEGLEARFREARKELSRDVQNLRDEIAAERKARDGSFAAIQARVKNMAIGNLRWEWVGAGWVLVGIVLGTVPEWFVWMF